MKTNFLVIRLRIAFLLCLVTFSSQFNLIKAQVQTPKYVSMTSMSNAYYEYLPQGYSSGSQTYPLLIFITGIGEVGDGSPAQLPKVLRHGPPMQIDQGIFPTSFTVNGQSFSFIVISPQFIDGPEAGEIDNVINYAVKNYRVDVSRIYLTGLSMGGGATWEYAGDNSTYANRLAAILPVSGASYPDVGRSQIIAASNLPVWATHNNNDPTVPSSYTIGYVNNINSAPVPPAPLAKKTIFESALHDAWTQTYDFDFKENGLNVYEWMLQYKRGSTPPVSNQPPVANAGSDISIALPVNSAQLNGSGSHDLDGTITYSWAKISGPSQYTISNSKIVNPVVSNLVSGTYTFRLTVTDNKGAIAINDMIVIVYAETSSGKAIPGKIEAEDYDNRYSLKTETTADTGGGLNVGGLGTGSWMDYNVDVAAAGMYKVNYRIATPYVGTQLQLKKSDGTILSTVNIPQTPSWQGWVTVSASTALTAGPQTLRIYVSKPSFNFNWFEFVNTDSTETPPANKPPVANSGSDVIITLPINSVTLNGAGTDVDGTIVSYLWTQYSGPSAATIGSPAQAKSTMSNLVEGVYIFNLKVTDNDGSTASDMVQLTVKPGAGQLPVDTKYINVNVYGGSNPYNDLEWNNWNVGTGTTSNITSGTFKFSDGTSSGIYSALNYSQAVGDNEADYQGGMAPVEVLRYTSYSNQARTLTISGLTTSLKYDIALYASRWSTGNNTLFTVNGSSVTITTFRNFTNKAVFNNISPTAQGQIIVSIKSGTDYNYLNGFTLTQQGADAPRPLTNVTQAGSVNQVITHIKTGEEESYINTRKPFLKNTNSLEIFPNPVRDMLIMQVNNLKAGIMNIQLINANGAVKKQFVLKNSLPGSNLKIPVNELPAGAYVIKVQVDDWSAIKKIIKL